MVGIAVRFIACTAALPLAAYLLPGVTAVGWMEAALVGAALGLLHMVLRPIVRLLLGVFNVLTLGLLSAVIDAWLVQIAAAMFPQAVQVASFWWALAASGIVNALRLLLGGFAKAGKSGRSGRSGRMGRSGRRGR